MNYYSDAAHNTTLEHPASSIKAITRRNVTDAPWNADPTGLVASTDGIRDLIAFTKAFGGTIHYPFGVYKIDDTLLHDTSTVVTCDGWGGVAAAATLTAPATRIEWHGDAGGTMVEVCAPNTGETMFGFVWQGPALLGLNSAGIAFHGRSLRYCHFDIWADRCTDIGIKHDDSNDALWADNTSHFMFYDSGSNAAAAESHGVVFWNESGHSGHGGDPLNLGCTNFSGGAIITTTANGDGIRMGDLDAFHIKKTHHVEKSGGTGEGARYCNTDGVTLNPGGAATGTRADGMKAQPRRTRKVVIGLIVGGNHHAEDGVGPIIADWINSESASYSGDAAAFHYRVMDRTHGDVFRTHEYVMSAARDIPIGLGSGSATGLGTLGGIGVQVVNYAAASTGAWNFSLPAPEEWANGRITGVKILHGGAVGDAVNTGVVVTVAAKVMQAGMTLGSGATSKTVTLVGPAANNTLPTEDTILFDTPVDYTRGQHLHLAISRVGGDAADIYPNSWSLATVVLLYTSDGPDSDGIDSFDVPLAFLA